MDPDPHAQPVNFIQQGQGTPVILLHGLAASLFDWNDLLPELAGAGYAAYALDLLGHGESGKPDNLNAYTVENVYAHFSRWLDTLGLEEPVILVGHSLGGYLASRYTLRHPERVRALVLVNPFLSPAQLPLFLRFASRRALVSTAWIEKMPNWLFRRAIDLTSLSIRNGFVLPDKVREQTATDYRRAHPGIFNLLHTIQDLTPRLPALSQPTLVLWGARDQTLVPAFFEKILRSLPNASGAGLPTAGHVPHQSHPPEFNRRVLEFLSGLKK